MRIRPEPVNHGSGIAAAQRHLLPPEKRNCELFVLSRTPFLRPSRIGMLGICKEMVASGPGARRTERSDETYHIV
jgi:hypothetical protein